MFIFTSILHHSRPGLKVIYYVVLLLDCILFDICCYQKEPLKTPRNLTPNRLSEGYEETGDQQVLLCLLSGLSMRSEVTQGKL